MLGFLSVLNCCNLYELKVVPYALSLASYLCINGDLVQASCLRSACDCSGVTGVWLGDKHDLRSLAPNP